MRVYYIFERDMDRGTRRIFFLCGVCVGICGCEKIRDLGAEGVSPREIRWAEVRPLVRFRPPAHWSARDAFREIQG